MEVTFAWCSEFEPTWKVRSLLHASRPPALFQYHLGCALAVTGAALAGRGMLDEDLGIGALSSEALAALGTSDIAYLSSHGRMDKNGTYQLRLRRGEWAPTATTQSSGPRVLVLDTCNVTTSRIKAHNSAWVAPRRPTPAIVLGFVGPATDGFSASMRGRAFAEHLAAGSTLEQSWFNAIQDTQPRRRRDEGIAIGFGDTQAAARSTLDTASLTNLPARTVADYCWWRSK